MRSISVSFSCISCIAKKRVQIQLTLEEVESIDPYAALNLICLWVSFRQFYSSLTYLCGLGSCLITHQLSPLHLFVALVPILHVEWLLFSMLYDDMPCASKASLLCLLPSHCSLAFCHNTVTGFMPIELPFCGLDWTPILAWVIHYECAISVMRTLMLLHSAISASKGVTLQDCLNQLCNAFFDDCRHVSLSAERGLDLTK